MTDLDNPFAGMTDAYGNVIPDLEAAKEQARVICVVCGKPWTACECGEPQGRLFDVEKEKPE